VNPPGSAEAVHGHCTYQLLISLRRRLRLKVGALGILDFPEGTYAYTGSARRSLASRIARHLARDKRLHWHIDYLLVRPEVRVTRVLGFDEPECVVNRRTKGVVVAGFGASDCRSHCGAHLKFLGPWRS
jgi:Uri superfamily endonuclease